jgi:hypothetical protein
VPRYLGGIHHMAQPTVDPRATLDFYVGVISSAARPRHLTV